MLPTNAISPSLKPHQRWTASNGSSSTAMGTNIPHTSNLSIAIQMPPLSIPSSNPSTSSGPSSSSSSASNRVHPTVLLLRKAITKVFRDIRIYSRASPYRFLLLVASAIVSLIVPLLLLHSILAFIFPSFFAAPPLASHHSFASVHVQPSVWWWPFGASKNSMDFQVNSDGDVTKLWFGENTDYDSWAKVSEADDAVFPPRDNTSCTCPASLGGGLNRFENTLVGADIVIKAVMEGDRKWVKGAAFMPDIVMTSSDQKANQQQGTNDPDHNFHHQQQKLIQDQMTYPFRVIRVLQVLRGPPLLAHFLIMVPERYIYGCYPDNARNVAEEIALEQKKTTDNVVFLVVGGKLDLFLDYDDIPKDLDKIHTVTQKKAAISSKIKKAYIKSKKQPKVSFNSHDLDSFNENDPSAMSSSLVLYSTMSPASCGAILFSPWNLLGPENEELLLHETDSSSSEWWRHRRRRPTSTILQQPLSNSSTNAPSSQPSLSLSSSFLISSSNSANNVQNVSTTTAPRIPENLAPQPFSPLSFLDTASEWWVVPGISIFTACKDRNEHLNQVIHSWLEADHVSEIVIVDYGSRIPVRQSLTQDVLQDERVRVVRIEGITKWSLARAFNVGARFTSRQIIFKVDCDAQLASDFFTAHPLNGMTYYAGDFRLMSSVDTELHMNGFLLVRRSAFMAVNGYDERIVTYGWDDSDISDRLYAIGLSRLQFNFTYAVHLEHSQEDRLKGQSSLLTLDADVPYANSVEIQKNRILLTKMELPKWDISSHRVHYNVFVMWTLPKGSNASHPDFANRITPTLKQYSILSKHIHLKYVLQPANELPGVIDLVTPEQLVDASKRAIRIILQDKFAIPAMPKELSLDFYRNLLRKVSLSAQYGHIGIDLQGTLSARLLGFASARVALNSSELDWRVKWLWPHPTNDCKCRFTEYFNVDDEEIYDAWADKSPPRFQELYPPIVPWENITVLSHALKDKDGNEKYDRNDTAYLRVKCGARVNDENRERIRDQLRKLIPSPRFLDSLNQKDDAIGNQVFPASATDSIDVPSLDEETLAFVDKWRSQKVEKEKFLQWMKVFMSNKYYEEKFLSPCSTDNTQNAEGSYSIAYPELVVIIISFITGGIECARVF